MISNHKKATSYPWLGFLFSIIVASFCWGTEARAQNPIDTMRRVLVGNADPYGSAFTPSTESSACTTIDTMRAERITM